MTSYFMSLWSTAQVTGLTCNFTLKCTISQDTFWPNSGAWRRSWLAHSAWQSGVVRICAPRASPRSAKFSWSVKGNLCRCDSLQMLGQGRLGCQAAVSSALSACKLCSQKPPFAPEFARGSYLLSFTLSVKFKRNQKETQSKARLGPSEFHLTSPRKSYPRVLLKHCPGSHAIQHKSSSAVQKGLPAPWEGHEPFSRLK